MSLYSTPFPSRSPSHALFSGCPNSGCAFSSRVCQVKHIKLSSKTGIPVGVLQQRHPDSQAKDARKHEDMAVSVPASVTRPRPRDETKEAKKLRKQAVKEERKVRALRSAYKLGV